MLEKSVNSVFSLKSVLDLTYDKIFPTKKSSEAIKGRDSSTYKQSKFSFVRKNISKLSYKKKKSINKSKSQKQRWVVAKFLSKSKKK